MKFNFIIGTRNEDGSIDDYMFHSSAVMYGDMKYAKSCLKNAKENADDEDTKWEIFKLIQMRRNSNEPRD